MFYKPLLLPLLIQVLLTFVVWHRMYFCRIAEMHKKNIKAQQIDTRANGKAVLTDSAASADNFENQFEMPVLFYLAIVLALMLLIQDYVLVVFAWLFVLLRIVHSFIHTTYNNVMHRFVVYIASCAALFILWVRLAWQIL